MSSYEWKSHPLTGSDGSWLIPDTSPDGLDGLRSDMQLVIALGTWAWVWDNIWKQGGKPDAQD